MLNINQLHKEIEKREKRKNKVYNTILDKVNYRILSTNTKTNDCFCIYLVPRFLFGVPLYNMTNCIIYIMEELIDKGFKVTYTHPNFLSISWKEKPKNIESKENNDLGLVDNNIYNNSIYHPIDIKTLELKTESLFN